MMGLKSFAPATPALVDPKLAAAHVPAHGRNVSSVVRLAVRRELLDLGFEACGLQARQNYLLGDGAHHRAALDAVVLDDAPGIFLRRFAGIFIGDGVKCFLVDQVLGGGEKRGEAEAQAQKDFHADESTGKRWFGKSFAADLRGWALISS